MNMNAVGIDVSKRKSTVAILRPGGEIVKKPFDVPHLSSDFRSLTRLIQDLDGETRIVMECTGHYYEPIARRLSQAGFFVSAVNPQIIRNFQGHDNPTTIYLWLISLAASKELSILLLKLLKCKSNRYSDFILGLRART